MTREISFPKNDWRSLYFTPENLRDTLDRVDAVLEDVPAGMSLAELALRFILEHPVVSTTIPGMRKAPHVAENTVRLGRPTTRGGPDGRTPQASVGPHTRHSVTRNMGGPARRTEDGGRRTGGRRTWRTEDLR